MRKYRFGDFELDLDAVQLRLNGEPVKLERRPLDLLILLVGRQGALVTREELVASLWPPRIVIDFETGLNTLVRKVRGALRDSSDNPRFIETVPGRGYRFIAPVTSSTTLDMRDAPNGTGEAREKPRGRLRTTAVAACAALALAAAVLVWQVGGEPETMRIAVLPFENLTGDDGLGYLTSGLAEETIASLSQIDLPDVRVVGGVSARAAADSTQSLAEVGRKLGADLLVVSSVRRDGPRIRVTSRLLRIADNEQIWTASFDRELTNVLGLQRELSIAIAEQIRQRLSPEVAAAIDRRQTQNPEAYALYLKGRHAWNQVSRGSVRDALQYFEQAAATDPGYALAWAGIAHTLITAPLTAGASRAAVEPRAREAMERALQHGPDLAEVQYTLGYFRNIVEWDPVGAQVAARRAVALDPNNPMARMFLGVLLAQAGHFTEALASLRRARELDPQFALVFANSAIIAANGGDPEAGLELARQAVVIGPEVWAAHYQLGNVYAQLGNDEAALEAYATAERHAGGNSLADERAAALARLGREREARATLAELKARAVHEHVSPFAFARVYANLGDTDAAFEWLERALAERDVAMLSIQNSYGFDSLHADPRFESLLRRRNLSARTHASSPECGQAC